MIFSKSTVLFSFLTENQDRSEAPGGGANEQGFHGRRSERCRDVGYLWLC